MGTKRDERPTAMQLLTRMFEVKMAFVGSDRPEHEKTLATAFHPDVVIHEPASLPYAGDWRGYDGIGALFRQMRQVWSAMDVRALQATLSGDIVFMTCTLRLTSRANGITIEQPFAEVLHFADDLLLEGTPFYFDTGELSRMLQPAMLQPAMREPAPAATASASGRQ